MEPLTFKEEFEEWFKTINAEGPNESANFAIKEIMKKAWLAGYEQARNTYKGLLRNPFKQ